MGPSLSPRHRSLLAADLQDFLHHGAPFAARVHLGVSSHPTDAWLAKPLREATPHGQTPRFLLRDRDGNHGGALARADKGSSIEILKAPWRPPKANAACKRFLEIVRGECLAHLLFVGERHLHRLVY